VLRGAGGTGAAGRMGMGRGISGSLKSDMEVQPQKLCFMGV
jgi:hypothetical protein